MKFDVRLHGEDIEEVIKIIEKGERDEAYSKIINIYTKGSIKAVTALLSRLYLGDAGAITRDVVKINVLGANNYPKISSEERCRVLQRLYSIILIYFQGDCAKFLQACKDTYGMS